MSISIKELLKKVVEAGASDLHIIVGAPPMARLHGGLEPLPGYERLKPEDTQEIIYTVMNEDQVAEFEAERPSGSVATKVRRSLRFVPGE